MQSWVTYKPFHPLWCCVWLVSLWAMVAIHRDVIWPRWGSMLWFEQGWNGGDGWIPSGDMACHAQICYGLNLRSRHPRTTCATTCPVWKGLLTNLVCYSSCVVFGWVGMAHVFVTSLCDILCELPKPHGAEGATLCGKPQHYKRGRLSGNRSKAWHTPVVGLCNGM
jgi:hypothetical protein